MSKNGHISRRAALISAAAVATAATATSAGAQTQKFTPYLSQDKVNYVTSPRVEQCNTCAHWGGSNCRVVEAATAPKGWCTAHTEA